MTMLHFTSIHVSEGGRPSVRTEKGPHRIVKRRGHFGRPAFVDLPANFELEMLSTRCQATPTSRSHQPHHNRQYELRTSQPPSYAPGPRQQGCHRPPEVGRDRVQGPPGQHRQLLQPAAGQRGGVHCRQVDRTAWSDPYQVCRPVLIFF